MSVSLKEGRDVWLTCVEEKRCSGPWLRCMLHLEMNSSVNMRWMFFPFQFLLSYLNNAKQSQQTQTTSGYSQDLQGAFLSPNFNSSQTPLWFQYSCGFPSFLFFALCKCSPCVLFFFENCSGDVTSDCLHCCFQFNLGKTQLEANCLCMCCGQGTVTVSILQRAVDSVKTRRHFRIKAWLWMSPRRDL